LLRPRKVAIYGAGLGARQALEIVRFRPDVQVVGLIDDNEALWGTALRGQPVLGGFEALKEGVLAGDIEAVALSFHSQVRRKIFLRLKEALDVEIQTLVDPRAIVSDEVEIGEGCFIEAGATIGPGTRIGDGAILDLGVTVCHDCFIGPHCHLAPGCTLSGIVKLEENVLVGVGAAVNSTVTIGPNVIISPGSAVMNDLPGDVVVSGVPAQIIGQSRRGE
jgi:UDP-perosamine 4-acetyltransferase